MNFLESKSFCPLPWINISADTDGSVRLCCISDEFIKKEDGTRFNLGYDKVEDIINSESYTQLRKNMLNGTEVSGCNKCYDAERANGISYRNQYIKLWANDEDLLKKCSQTLNNQPIDETVQYYDLRFGNLCNLSCRSCYSGASSQFNKDVKELKDTNIGKFHGWIDKDLNSWYETETFKHNLDSQAAHIKEYYSTGGEPTLNHKNYETLVGFIESGHSKHMTLKFNTNLTNTKKDFYSLLPHFKNLIVMGSVDGYKEMQEYLRYPSDWNQISANIEKLIGMNITNSQFVLTPVIQKVNLGYITELFEYAESFNRKAGKSVIYISPIILLDPSYLDFNFLPVEYKVQCWDRIEKWINEKCQFQGPTFHNRMNQIKAKCFTEVEYKDNLVRFFEFTDIFDKHRNENITNVNPELSLFRV